MNQLSRTNTVTDMPGLIEGASRNRGLGFSFLRHVEQCRSLIYVLDLSYPHTISQYNALKYELNNYQGEMADRKHIIVANKMDLKISRRNYEELINDLEGDEVTVLPLSAKNCSDIEPLIERIRDIYDSVKDK